MIYYYSGKPGGGKSLHAAKVIEEYLRQGKYVIANFEFRDDLIKKHWAHDLGKFVYWSDDVLLDNVRDPVQKLVDFAAENHKLDKYGSVIEEQTLLVIDEAENLYNARTWQDRYRQRWLWFYSQYRKMGYIIIMISQNEKEIDKQIRGKFEYEVAHKRVGNYKKLGKLLEILTFGKVFCYVQRWYGSSGRDAKDTPVFFRGRRKYYKMYNTSMIFGGQDA